MIVRWEVYAENIINNIDLICIVTIITGDTIIPTPIEYDKYKYKMYRYSMMINISYLSDFLFITRFLFSL